MVGRIATPSLLRRVEFPLIHTLNINVELSQVRLRLPEAYDWFNFGGTLGRVQSESELQAGWLSYRTRQLTELSQLLGSSSIVSDYTRARALNNLSTLESAIQQQSEAFTQNSRQSQELGKQWVDNSAALQAAQQQALQASQNQPSEGRGNRALLNDLYGVQSNGRSYNALGELGQNFSMQVPVPYPESAGKVADEANAASQNEWFSQNKLENSKPAEIGSRIAAAQQNLPATSSPTSSDPTAPYQQLQTPQLQTPDVVAGKRLKSAPQDGEGKDSQADRYNKRLQAQRGRAEALGDQNYGSTAQSAGRQSGTAANGMQNSGGFGAGGMGGEARDKMDSNFRMQAPGFMPPPIAELPITESQSAESMPPFPIVRTSVAWRTTGRSSRSVHGEPRSGFAGARSRVLLYNSARRSGTIWSSDRDECLSTAVRDCECACDRCGVLVDLHTEFQSCAKSLGSFHRCDGAGLLRCFQFDTRVCANLRRARYPGCHDVDLFKVRFANRNRLRLTLIDHSI